MSDKKSKIPYFFFAFFAVTIAVNVLYIYISKQTWSGLVTTDGYKKGLNYNETLQQEEAQKKLGWSVEVDFAPKYDNKFTIIFKLRDKNHRLINDAEILVDFKRPASEGIDFSRQIRLVDGTYQSDIDFPAKGQWDMSIMVISGQNKFAKLERRFIQW